MASPPPPVPSVDDSVLMAIRNTIAKRFGHELSPESPSLAPDLPSSVVPLLDLQGSVTHAPKFSPSDERKTSPYHILASPPPPPPPTSVNSGLGSPGSLRKRSEISASRPVRARGEISRRQEPLTRTNRVLNYGDLGHTQRVQQPLPSSGSLRPQLPITSQIQASPPRQAAIPETKTKTAHFEKDFGTVPPLLGSDSGKPSTTMDSTSGNMSSGQILSNLFSSKLIPLHNPGSPSPLRKSGPSSNNSNGLSAEAAAIQSSKFEALIRKRSAYLGHRHEVERYASLLALRDMFTEYRRMHPNQPLPLSDVVLGSAVVMLDQAPLRAPPSNDHNPRCHCVCLEVIQLFGAQAAGMVARLSSLLQRLWVKHSRVSNGRKEPGDELWLGVSTKWVIEAILATGLAGIDELLRLCTDGYGQRDRDILAGIVQHPSIQQVVVAPALAEELIHPDLSRSKSALRALVALGERAEGTAGHLKGMLDITSVKPALVCAALASTTTGESVLLESLSNSTRSNVRSAAAAALGYKYALLQLKLKDGSAEMSTTHGTLLNSNNTVVSIAQAASAAREANPNTPHAHVTVSAQICGTRANAGPPGMNDMASVRFIANPSTGRKMIVLDSRHLLGSLMSLRNESGRRDESWFFMWSKFVDSLAQSSSADANERRRAPNSVIMGLFSALKDSAGEVRATSLVALSLSSSAADLASYGMMENIVASMRDVDAQVRTAAAEAIGRLGPEALEFCGEVSSGSDFKGPGTTGATFGIKSVDPQTPTRRLRLDNIAKSAPRSSLQHSSAATGRSVLSSASKRIRTPAFTPGSTRFRRSRQSSQKHSKRGKASDSATSFHRKAPASKNKILSHLQSMLQDRIHRVRLAACIAVGHLGPAANEIAMDLLRVMDEGRLTRTVAARALIKLEPTGQQLLLDLLCNARCLTKGGEKTRIAAAVGIGCMDEKSMLFDPAVRVLYDVCRDPKPGVRAAALYALGKLGKKTEERVLYLRARSLLPFVYSHLRDNDELVRVAAAKVLAKAEPQGEMLLIEGLLQDEDERVRVAITHGLSVVGPSCIRTAILALSDSSSAVRNAVSNVILGFGVDGIAGEIKKRNITSRDSLSHEISALLEDSHKVFPAELDRLFLALVGRIQGYTVYSR